MNEPTPPHTTTRPNFFTSDSFTIFFSSESAVWLYGASAINISKHTPRVKITELTPLERVPIGFRKTLLPVDGITGEKGHYSIYVMGFAADFPLDFPGSMINDPYVKQKIEEHYTYNYPPTTTTTP
jgi:hypothetical protein